MSVSHVEQVWYGNGVVRADQCQDEWLCGLFTLPLANHRSLYLLWYSDGVLVFIIVIPPQTGIHAVDGLPVLQYQYINTNT